MKIEYQNLNVNNEGVGTFGTHTRRVREVRTCHKLVVASWLITIWRGDMRFIVIEAHVYVFVRVRGESAPMSNKCRWLEHPQNVVWEKVFTRRQLHTIREGAINFFTGVWQCCRATMTLQERTTNENVTISSTRDTVHRLMGDVAVAFDFQFEWNRGSRERTS